MIVMVTLVPIPTGGFTMKRLKMTIMSIAFFFMFTNITQANSEHTVSGGESLWSIGVDYGVLFKKFKN